MPLSAAAVATPAATGGALALAGVPWWRKGVVYHVYPRSFCDSNGDGVGDLKGIIARLDYLNDGSTSSLGVDAIWLSPIYPSPLRDGGYDVADHTAIDPSYGTIGDFDCLIAEAHRRGIRIILDLVLNHTSDLHPWFQQAVRERSSSRRDWYVWRDPRPGGGEPNNWRSFFGGPAWTLDPDSGQYYLHTFLSQQPDLNWHNPEVRAAALDIVSVWLDRSVDGFRLDVFNAYFKHPELLNNPRRIARDPWSRQRHIYNKDRPELHGFLAELRAKLDEHPGAIAIGEAFECDAELTASYCDKLHMAFDFDFLKQDWRPRDLQRAITRWDGLLMDHSTWPTYVLSNHDNSRHASRFGRFVNRSEADARAKVAAALLLTLRGTPFLYYGEEIGMHDAGIPAHETWDLGAPGGFSRDPARSPMQWDGFRHAGFTAGVPWIRVAADHGDRNVLAQQENVRSVLHFYRELIWLRKQSAALTLGSWEPLILEPRDAMAYLRRHGSDLRLIVLNFSGRRQRIRLDVELPCARWTPNISTRRPDIGWSLAVGRSLDLGPYEATVFEAIDPFSV